MIFGANDPHVPSEGRNIIDQKLRASGVRYHRLLYPAEHAFMRDEGPRFDPEATDQAFRELIALFRRVF
jgi:carboxymethylenebutenolidase